MWLFRRKPPATPIAGLTRDQALRLRPERNELVREERVSEDVVRLVYPLAWKPWFGRLAKRFGAWDQQPVDKKLELDALGAVVWGMIDGRRTVREISDAFARRYKLHPREAEVSVAAVPKEKGKRGLILLG